MFVPRFRDGGVRSLGVIERKLTLCASGRNDGRTLGAPGVARLAFGRAEIPSPEGVQLATNG
jgi:hypothetical protein